MSQFGFANENGFAAPVARQALCEKFPQGVWRAVHGLFRLGQTKQIKTIRACLCQLWCKCVLHAA
ncbi:MAG TPA: hypothetical protein VMV89_05830, partial [Candidatus Paceibacterota bacterium]|nr:hypothetical protein [Candidatus Paceibacterota bacterium]